jgi:hypothetical protein
MAYLMAARPQGADVSICLLLETTSMGPGSSLPSSTAADRETSVAGRDSEPLFIAQIAACVRFWTLILRRIALTWTFTVASAIYGVRAAPGASAPRRAQPHARFGPCL